jgi:Ni/Co efflux regulator RcnB
MKKALTAALAATLAVSSLGVASTASAQSRDHSRGQHEQRQDRRDDRREDRQDRREDRREWRQDQREDRREARQDQRAYARWQQAQRRYNAGRYYAPRGYAVRTWSYGQRMPSYYRSNQYVVSDYGRYGLRQPPRGYQYVRSGNDVVMTAIATGLITAVIAGMFN